MLVSNLYTPDQILLNDRAPGLSAARWVGYAAPELSERPTNDTVTVGGLCGDWDGDGLDDVLPATGAL
eukprot:SAG22_NODE_1264_length_4966_cov_1.918430_2_plen_68_part_00